MKSQNYSKRVKKLQNALNGIPYLIEDPVDLFYLTGLSLSEGRIVIHPKESMLFVDGRYIDACKEKSPVSVSLYNQANLHHFLKVQKINRLSFDPDKTTYTKLQKWKDLLAVKPHPNPLKELRMIKDPDELKALKRSARCLQKGLEYIQKKLLKTGISEKEIALEFEIFSRRHGAEKLAFDPIIAFGPNSAMPHHRTGERRLKKGDIVLIDIGVVVDHYHSDRTRVLFFGEPKPQLSELEEVVRKAQSAALKECRPGVPLGLLDEAARREMAKVGLEKHYLHSLGHGLGLEIHEFPRIKQGGEDQNVLLQKGMVVTIEPGLYLPGIGGVRIEDAIVITKKGYEFLK